MILLLLVAALNFLAKAGDLECLFDAIAQSNQEYMSAILSKYTHDQHIYDNFINQTIQVCFDHKCLHYEVVKFDDHPGPLFRTTCLKDGKPTLNGAKFITARQYCTILGHQEAFDLLNNKNFTASESTSVNKSSDFDNLWDAIVQRDNDSISRILATYDNISDPNKNHLLCMYRELCLSSENGAHQIVVYLPWHVPYGEVSRNLVATCKRPATLLTCSIYYDNIDAFKLLLSYIKKTSLEQLKHIFYVALEFNRLEHLKYLLITFRSLTRAQKEKIMLFAIRNNAAKNIAGIQLLLDNGFPNTSNLIAKAIWQSDYTTEEKVAIMTTLFRDYQQKNRTQPAIDEYYSDTYSHIACASCCCCCLPCCFTEHASTLYQALNDSYERETPDQNATGCCKIC